MTEVSDLEFRRVSILICTSSYLGQMGISRTVTVWFGLVAMKIPPQPGFGEIISDSSTISCYK